MFSRARYVKPPNRKDYCILGTNNKTSLSLWGWDRGHWKGPQGCLLKWGHALDTKALQSHLPSVRSWLTWWNWNLQMSLCSIALLREQLTNTVLVTDTHAKCLRRHMFWSLQLWNAYKTRKKLRYNKSMTFDWIKMLFDLGSKYTI